MKLWLMCYISDLVVCNTLDQVDPHAEEEETRQEKSKGKVCNPVDMKKVSKKKTVTIMQTKQTRFRSKKNTERSILEYKLAQEHKKAWTCSSEIHRTLRIQEHVEIIRNTKKLLKTYWGGTRWNKSRKSLGRNTGSRWGTSSKHKGGKTQGIKINMWQHRHQK